MGNGDKTGQATGIPASWGDLLAQQIRQHGRLFYRVALRVVNDRATAEDVCQTAFLKAWERPSIDPGAIRPWLVTTIINGALELVRRKKIEQRVLRVQASADESDRATYAHRARFRSEAVRAAVEKLPDVPRAVVMLRLLNGLSGNETKDVLGCSAAEVSRQLHRGIQQLRVLLRPESPGER